LQGWAGRHHQRVVCCCLQLLLLLLQRAFSVACTVCMLCVSERCCCQGLTRGPAGLAAWGHTQRCVCVSPLLLLRCPYTAGWVCLDLPACPKGLQVGGQPSAVTAARLCRLCRYAFPVQLMTVQQILQAGCGLRVCVVQCAAQAFRGQSSVRCWWLEMQVWCLEAVCQVQAVHACVCLSVCVFGVPVFRDHFLLSDGLCWIAAAAAAVCVHGPPVSV
jgi:hypothetical protein